VAYRGYKPAAAFDEVKEEAPANGASTKRARSDLSPHARRVLTNAKSCSIALDATAPPLFAVDAGGGDGLQVSVPECAGLRVVRSAEWCSAETAAAVWEQLGSEAPSVRSRKSARRSVSP
jgi:hypothetical protein